MAEEIFKRTIYKSILNDFHNVICDKTAKEISKRNNFHKYSILNNFE